LICFNDRLALDAYQALSDAGLANPTTSPWSPSTTTSSRPECARTDHGHYELGRAAVELLLEHAQTAGSGEAHVHRIPMPLRNRESVGRNTTAALSPHESTVT
jgi:LacI family transcriptional regulator